MQAPKELTLSVLKPLGEVFRQEAPNTPSRGANTVADSGKHAFSVIEGAVKSRAIKGEGFGERGRGRVRGVGIPESTLSAWLKVQPRAGR